MDISNNFNFTFNEISNNTIDSLNLFNNNNDISNNVIQNLEQELNEFLDIFGLNIPPPRPVTPPTETIFNDISDVNFFNFFDISRNRRRTRYQPLRFPRRNIRWNTRDDSGIIGRRLFSNNYDPSSFLNTRFVSNGIFNMDNILEETLLDPKIYKNVLSEEGKNTIKFQTYDISNNTEEICPITLAPFKQGDEIAVLPCSHKFTKEYILKWLETEQAKCPICRFEFDSIEKKNDISNNDTTPRNISRPMNRISNRFLSNRPRTIRRNIPIYNYRPRNVSRDISNNIDNDIYLQQAIMNSLQNNDISSNTQSSTETPEITTETPEINTTITYSLLPISNSDDSDNDTLSNEFTNFLNSTTYNEFGSDIEEDYSSSFEDDYSFENNPPNNSSLSYDIQIEINSSSESDIDTPIATPTQEETQIQQENNNLTSLQHEIIELENYLTNILNDTEIDTEDEIVL